MTAMRFIGAVAAGLAVALVVLGLAASNTVPITRAGDGASTISGYTVSSVTYNLNATNPQEVSSVVFTLDAPANKVKVRLQSDGAWFDCTNVSGNQWSCTTSGQAVQPADELRVVASY
jgi:hypothetical protein